MKRLSKLIVTSLLSLTTLTMVACGGKTNTENNNQPSNEATEGTKKEDIKGTVVFANPGWGGQMQYIDKLIESFNEVYPNVKIELLTIEGDSNEFLTAQAASGKLPDLVMAYAPMVYPLSQGWVYPLDDFIKNDPDFKYVADSLTNDFKFDGKLYALPATLTLSGVVVNLDLMEKLNLDPPSYDWTTTEFMDYARKATTSEYSGVSMFYSYEEQMLGMFGKDLAGYGYNTSTQSFNFTDGSFARGMAFKKEMLSVPGLLATTLQNQELKDAGKEDDYQKKFGKDVDGFNDGKILFEGTGLWNLGDRPFNYDYYPLPTDSEVGYRQGIHIDHIYMTSDVADENKEAAFEFLKWLTYSPKGTMVKFKAEGDNPEVKNCTMLPATNHPDVSTYFKSVEKIPGGIKYIYDNLDKSYRVDISKVVPGLSTAVSEVLSPQFKRIDAGETEVASIAAELEQQANNKLTEARNQLKADMDKYDHYK